MLNKKMLASAMLLASAMAYFPLSPLSAAISYGDDDEKDKQARIVFASDDEEKQSDETQNSFRLISDEDNDDNDVSVGDDDVDLDEEEPAGSDEGDTETERQDADDTVAVV